MCIAAHAQEEMEVLFDLQLQPICYELHQPRLGSLLCFSFQKLTLHGMAVRG